MKKETSCINSRAVIQYVKAHNNGQCGQLLLDLDPELEDVFPIEAYLCDPNNWISCEVLSTLYQRAKTILNDPRAPYKIARYAVECARLGYMQRIVLKAFGSHIHALRNAQRLNDKFNRSKKVLLKALEPGYAVVRLYWDRSMNVSRDNCLYNQGAYTYLPLAWGGKPLTLTETACYFDGHPYCEYRLRWSQRSRLLDLFRSTFVSKSVLMETIAEMEKDKQVIEDKYEEVNRLNRELSARLRQLTAVQETSKAILSILELDRLIDLILNLLYDTCSIHRAIIMLVNESTRQLEYRHGVGFQGEVPKNIREYRIPLSRQTNLMARVAASGKAEYIPDIDHSSLKKDNVIIAMGKPTSAFVLPLITRSKVIGVIATDAIDHSGVPQETRDTLEIFAPLIAIAIENARLYSRLHQQMKELKQSHRLLGRMEKISFLGNLAARLAHEIRNPMTAIGTFIQMLPSHKDDDDFMKDFHGLALEETRRINNLLSELLDLTNTPEAQFGRHDLNGLIRKMVTLISPQANAKHITIACRLDDRITTVRMDEEQIRQVLLNLLANSVEASPENSQVTITTRLIHPRNDREWIQIQLRDTGPGISPKIADKVFDPYFTTKHKSSIHKGTGLGLFIAHQHIQNHNGSIVLDKQYRDGTGFVIHLPVDESPENAGNTKEDPDAASFN